MQRLTGGVLILRNKFFIILYRGKDFLPSKVAKNLTEREAKLHDQLLLEEAARANAVKTFTVFTESTPRTNNIGSFLEFKDIQSNYHSHDDSINVEKIKIEAERVKLLKELKDEEYNMSILNNKIEKSEKELAKLNNSWSTSEQSADQELLTEEEKQSFKRIGLKMDEFVLLGRRGVYSGTIESIRQHWKHREVVKVISMQHTIQQVEYTAKILEVESGGSLVAVEKLKKGHAIIIYRGKNYARSLKPSGENLLTKREALQKSIEIQRRGSMKYFARKKQKAISELKEKLKYLEQKTKELDADETRMHA